MFVGNFNKCVNKDCYQHYIYEYIAIALSTSIIQIRRCLIIIRFDRNKKRESKLTLYLAVSLAACVRGHLFSSFTHNLLTCITMLSSILEKYKRIRSCIDLYYYFSFKFQLKYGKIFDQVFKNHHLKVLKRVRVRKCTAMTGFVRISRIYLITGFTLVADQQFVVERVYK